MAVSIEAGPQTNGTYFSDEELYVTLESDRFSGGSPPYIPTEANLQAYLELYNKTADPDELIVALQAPYNHNTKQTAFNLGRFAPVNYELPSTASIQGAPLITGEAVDAVMQLYFKYGDKFGSPPVPESLTTSDDFFVIKGSRSAENNRGGQLTTAVATAPFFLLHSIISHKMVSFDQPDWLYLYTESAFTIDIDVQLLFEDGTSNTVDVVELALDANKVYWMQAGLPQLNIDAAGLYAYKLILKKSGESVAWEATYVIDRTCQDWGINLLYANGLGGLETIHFKGKGQHEYEVSRGDPFSAMRWQGFNIQDGEIERTTSEGGRVIGLHSGFYPRHQVELLQQLLHARVWRINEATFEKWIITSSSIKTAEDDADLFYLEIEIRPGWVNDNHTAQTITFA